MPKFIPVVASFVFAALGMVSSEAAPVIVEAEAGALGSDWTVSNSTSPAFVTIQSNSNANNPGTSNRVATYTVTFPGAATYELYARLRVGPNGANDDSLFYGNRFGTKSPSTDNVWRTKSTAPLRQLERGVHNQCAAMPFSWTTDITNNPPANFLRIFIGPALP